MRLFTLCVLYVAQGIPWGFMVYTIPAYLASKGLTREAISLAFVTTTLPYSFKWIWGLVIDTFQIPRFGRRRPWIVLAQLLMAATMLAIVAIPDLTSNLKLLAQVMLVHTAFNALQDVAVDALAIDILDEDERGRANGFMYAAKYGGGMIGGTGMGAVVHYASFEAALVVQAVILLAIMMVPLLVRERDDEPPPRPRARDTLRGLVEVFSLRSAFVAALLMLSLHVALGLLNANAATLYQQVLGWSQKQYTDFGGISLAVGLASAVAGGFLADLLGRRRLIALASIAMGAGWLVFAAGEMWWRSNEFVYAVALWEAACTSFMAVGSFALCMDVAYPAVGGSQFTAYMALSNFSTTFGYHLAGKLAWDYRDLYIAAGLAQAAVSALLLLIDPGQTRRVLPRPAGTPLPRIGLVATGLLIALLVTRTWWVAAPLLCSRGIADGVLHDARRRQRGITERPSHRVEAAVSDGARDITRRRARGGEQQHRRPQAQHAHHVAKAGPEQGERARQLAEIAPQLPQRQLRDERDLLERRARRELLEQRLHHRPQAHEALGLVGDDALGQVRRQHVRRAEPHDQLVQRVLGRRRRERGVRVPHGRRQVDGAVREADRQPHVGGGHAQLDDRAGRAPRAELERFRHHAIELGLGEHVRLRAADRRSVADRERALE